MTIGGHSRFALVGALLLAAIFAFAGIDKLLHYEGFVNAVRSFAVVPRGAAAAMAAPVIALELLLALLLMLPSARSRAALATATLLGCFTLAVALDMVFEGRKVCGCWFSITTAGGGWHLAQNLLLIVLALVVWHDCRRGSASRWEQPRPQAVS